MKRKVLLRIVFMLLFSAGTSLFAQDKPPDKPKVPESGHAQRKAARKKWKEERKQKKLEKKGVRQHHKKIQTKKTYRRMKRDKRHADRVNAHKPEFFLKRWFRKKHK